MRSPSTTPAIVLRSRSFGESDKIVSFLTQDYGKITGIAKGAKRSRKRFVNSLEPFSLVNLRFHDRPYSSLVFIQSCDWIRVFKQLTSNLEHIAYASYLVEITDELTREREENRAPFDHLQHGLIFIEEHGAFPLFLTVFELGLLKLSGYEPMLERCRRCGERPFGSSAKNGNGWRFSPADGGIICAGCFAYRRETLPLSLEALSAMAMIQKQDFVVQASLRLSPSALKETRSLLPRFIQFQIHKELKSIPFLEEL